jgi:hypothetical protein
MNQYSLLLIGTAVCSCLTLTSPVHAQGSLTPPGAPAPTMKTLAQIEPRTPIPSLPYTITNSGSYYLTTNLVGIGGSAGVTINANNVTLDLNGFTLQGVPLSGNGIYVANSFTNLVFRNGSITGWGSHGIDTYSAAFPRNMVFDRLTISGNAQRGIFSEAGCIVRDCLFIGNGSDGFNSVGGEITGCLARNNGGYGFSVYGAELHQCVGEYNTGGGFSLSYSRALDCNSKQNSGNGFTCVGAGDAIRGCRSANNTGNGVQTLADANGTVVQDCEIANNSGYGIYTTGVGAATIAGNNLTLNGFGNIVINDSGNYIENNHVVTTTGVYGIAISSSAYTNNVVVKNVVTGGALGVNYSNIGGANDFGPLGSAATATSPWANISN